MSYLQGCKRFLKDLFQDDHGQATVEYLLVLSVTIVIASALSRKVLEVMDRGILRLGGELEKDLKTGRAPLIVWKN